MSGERRDRVVIVSVRIPVGLIEKIDELIERGFFFSRGEVIRYALRRMFLDGREEKVESEKIGEK